MKLVGIGLGCAGSMGVEGETLCAGEKGEEGDQCDPPGDETPSVSAEWEGI